jgi:hypothetical protein
VDDARDSGIEVPGVSDTFDGLGCWAWAERPLSGKLATKGDWRRDDDAEATIGDSVAATLELFGAVTLDVKLLTEASSVGSLVVTPGEGPSISFVTPTDALIRLYSPLSPPWTMSPPNPFPSPLLWGLGGEENSSNVVNASDREAVV